MDIFGRVAPETGSKPASEPQGNQEARVREKSTLTKRGSECRIFSVLLLSLNGHDTVGAGPVEARNSTQVSHLLGLSSAGFPGAELKLLEPKLGL